MAMMKACQSPLDALAAPSTRSQLKVCLMFIKMFYKMKCGAPKYWGTAFCSEGACWGSKGRCHDGTQISDDDVLTTASH